MISIVVPAYNVEAYLPACLDSLLRQTHSDFELLLIDDESTDATAAIAESYSRRDVRIRLFRLSKRYAWAARNYGLDAARGEYITFLDADDTLHPAALATLLNAAVRHRATTVIAGHYEIPLDDPTAVAPLPVRTVVDRVMGPRTALRAFINGKLRTAVWGTLYRSEQLETLRFTDRQCAEDGVFTPAQLSRSPRTVAIAPCLYYYRRRNGSITTTLTPSRTQVVASCLYRHDLCKRLYPWGKLRAVAAQRVIGATSELSLEVVATEAAVAAWRRRIYSLIPRWRLLLLSCNPILSLRYHVLGSFLVLGLRPNAWLFRRIRAAYRLMVQRSA